MCEYCCSICGTPEQYQRNKRTVRIGQKEKDLQFFFVLPIKIFLVTKIIKL